MKTHRWLLPASTRARSGPARNPSAVARARAGRRAVRLIAVPGLALGALAMTAVNSGHGSVNHGSAHYGTATDRPVASVSVSSGHAIANPWIY